MNLLLHCSTVYFYESEILKIYIFAFFFLNNVLFTEDIFKTMESYIFVGAIIIHGLFRFMVTYSHG